jgi:hypothetical protein
MERLDRDWIIVHSEKASFDKLRTSSFDKLRTSSFDKLRTSSFGRLRTSSFDKLRTSSFDRLRTSSFDKLRMPCACSVCRVIVRKSTGFSIVIGFRPEEVRR